MSDKSVRAILFDWDLTLAYSIDPHISHLQRLTKLFQNHGIPNSDEQIAEALQSLKADIEAGVVTGVVRPQKRREIITQYRQLLARLDYPDTSYDFSYKIYSGYALLPHTLYDDVEDTLSQLKSRGYRLGVLTNHSRSVRPVIEQELVGLVEPKAITISEEVGSHKPTKSIFRRAAGRVRVPASKTIYVGDNFEVDAVGAIRNGGFARGVWLDRSNTGANKKLPAGVRRVTSLSELPEIYK